MSEAVVRPVSFGEAFSSGLRNTFNFQGRARRSEYWWFYLGWTPIAYVCSILVHLGLGSNVFNPDAMPNVFTIEGHFENLFSLPTLIGMAFYLPSTSLTVRRLHDRGVPGWIVLGPILLPVVGMIFGFAIFILTLLEGHRRENRYGPDPKFIGNHV